MKPATIAVAGETVLIPCFGQQGPVAAHHQQRDKWYPMNVP